MVMNRVQNVERSVVWALDQRVKSKLNHVIALVHVSGRDRLQTVSQQCVNTPMIPIGQLESYASRPMDKFKTAQTIQKELRVKNRVMPSTTAMRLGSTIRLLVIVTMTVVIVDSTTGKSTVVWLR